MGPVDVVRQLVEPLLAAEGVELVDCELKGGILSITVDAERRNDAAGQPDGIDIDSIGKISKRVSLLLDEHDPIPTRYTLEVSSPGLERPLRTPEHFARAVGTPVSVRTHARADGDRRVQGVLESADASGITIGGRTIAYDEIERARTVFEWGGQPKPGAATRSKPVKSKKKAAS